MISVVIPAHNEEHSIADCLKSLTTQSYKGGIEIIVVDNASTDKTSAVAGKFPPKIIHEGRKGVTFARQAGFAAAKGEIIASTDADTVLPRNWLQIIDLAFSRDEKLVGLGGPVLPKKGTKFEWFLSKSAMIGLYLTSLFKFGFFIGSNFAVRKADFEKIGGFDLKKISGEDVDLCARLSKVGKVKFIFNVKAYASMRRLRDQGIIRFSKHHVTNWIRLNVTKKSPLPFSDIRDY
jgi:glycosyltransferase involved in cell wall biosynthesis